MMAQKAFLLLCDLYKITSNDDSDIKAIKQASVYGTMLSRIISTMPEFRRSGMDLMTKKSYASAVKVLEERQWFSIKNDLMVCCNLIYENTITTTDSSNNSYTINLNKDWSNSESKTL